MKKILLIMLISGMCLLAAIATAATKEQVSPAPGIAAYNPTTEYNGAYESDFIYYKNPGASVWLRVTNLDRLRHISCPDALRSLNKQGTWRGHLNPDGSCGPTSEPSDWALGNWLNYRDSLPDTDEQ